MRVFDDWDARTAADGIILINLPPSQPAVTITWPSASAKPDTTDDLTCNITTATIDPEGEQVYYKFQWLKEGVPQPGLVKTTRMYPSGYLPVEVYNLSYTLLRPWANWTCKVTPYDVHSASGLPASIRVTIQPPNGAICDGTDHDGDGKIDEGMLSCWNNESFMVDGRKYCFDCKNRTSFADLENSCRTQIPGQKGYQAILGDQESESDVLAISTAYIQNVLPYDQNQGLYVRDTCKGLKATLGDTSSAYVDSAPNVLDCNEPQLLLDAKGGAVGGVYKGRISDGTGLPAYGAVCEFTEICNGVDDNDNGFVDETTPFSCSVGGGFVGPQSRSTYCVSCKPTSSISQARANAPTGWYLSQITSNETTADISFLISKISTIAMPYLLAPRGFYVNDSRSVVRSFFNLPMPNPAIYGYDPDTGMAYPPGSGPDTEIAFTSWSDLSGTPSLDKGKLVKASPSGNSDPNFYGSVYEGGAITLTTWCGDGIVQNTPPNSLGQVEECEFDANCTAAKPLCDKSNCTCVPNNTHGWCPDGHMDPPGETCDTGGNNLIGPTDARCGVSLDCCSAGFFCNDVICACESATRYDGYFNSQTSRGSTVKDFPVTFTDASTLSPPAPVPWIFNFNDFVGSPAPEDCITSGPVKCESHMLEGSKVVPYHGTLPLNSITVAVKPDGACFAYAQAAPPTGAAVIGFYGIDTRNLAALCPSCKVVEIPAIMNPLSMYSGSLPQATKDYASATVAVNTLKSRCAVTCSSTAEGKLQEALTHEAAATLYYSDCQSGASGSPLFCRMVGYYSSRARALAEEGMVS